MSDTPETNSIIRNAQAADHPPTRLAATLTVKCEKLERERDEARESLKHISEYGTDEINAAVELRQKLATALVERDEARDKAERYRLEANAIMMQRDEAREEANKLSGAYEDATNYYARIIELKEELDEAREEIKRLKVILDLIKKDVS